MRNTALFAMFFTTFVGIHSAPLPTIHSPSTRNLTSVVSPVLYSLSLAPPTIDNPQAGADISIQPKNASQAWTAYNSSVGLTSSRTIIVPSPATAASICVSETSTPASSGQMEGAYEKLLAETRELNGFVQNFRTVYGAIYAFSVAMLWCLRARGRWSRQRAANNLQELRRAETAVDVKLTFWKRAAFVLGLLD